MAKDKFAATWVSHSSISDFLKCPRAYYLNNVYKDPLTRHKIALINPYMALGQAVHEVIESLSVLPTDIRFKEPLSKKYDAAWEKVSGLKGGFYDRDKEQKFKNLGHQMIRRVIDNPGPLKNLAIKIQKDLPYYWLSEDDEIILCGKIDWIEYLPDTDQVHIIDFKTGKKRESSSSLQLPIYYLLASNCQKRAVRKASYWYLSLDKEPIEQPSVNLDDAHNQVLKIAKEIKLCRKLNKFKCPQDGCRNCKPYETIISGKAQLVDTNEYNQDVYILPDQNQSQEDSIIL